MPRPVNRRAAGAGLGARLRVPAPPDPEDPIPVSRDTKTRMAMTLRLTGDATDAPARRQVEPSRTPHRVHIADYEPLMSLVISTCPRTRLPSSARAQGKPGWAGSSPRWPGLTSRASVRIVVVTEAVDILFQRWERGHRHQSCPAGTTYMAIICDMESYCYTANMDHNMTPQAAIRTAEAARKAAAARATPAWFAGVAGALFAAGLTGVGTAQLIGFHHVVAKVTGLAGTACCLAFGLMYVLLIALWMRRGVIPLSPSCAKPRNQLRDRDLWILAGILAASAAAWAATGHLGWAVIVFGITEGVHHWRRILPGAFGPPRPSRARNASRT